jgi:uncharacterized protein
MLLLIMLLLAAPPDLIQAVSNGDEAVVQKMLASGANVNAAHPLTQWTALDIACFKGYSKIAEELIAAHADVNSVDKNGSTPLMKAVSLPSRSPEMIAEKIKIVRLLLKSGADPGAKDRFGSNSWQQAMQNGTPEMVDAFEDAGVKGVRETRLMLAIASKDPDEVDALLKKGADVNWKDADGYTALSEAVLSHNAGMLQAVLDHGADVNLKFQKGWTALMIATHENQPDLVRTLLAAGADRTIASDNGVTALQLAETEGRITIIPLLQK